MTLWAGLEVGRMAERAAAAQGGTAAAQGDAERAQRIRDSHSCWGLAILVTAVELVTWAQGDPRMEGLRLYRVLVLLRVLELCLAGAWCQLSNTLRYPRARVWLFVCLLAAKLLSWPTMYDAWVTVGDGPACGSWLSPACGHRVRASWLHWLLAQLLFTSLHSTVMMLWLFSVPHTVQLVYAVGNAVRYTFWVAPRVCTAPETRSSPYLRAVVEGLNRLTGLDPAGGFQAASASEAAPSCRAWLLWLETLLVCCALASLVLMQRRREHKAELARDGAGAGAGEGGPARLWGAAWTWGPVAVVATGVLWTVCVAAIGAAQEALPVAADVPVGVLGLHLA